MSEPASHGCYCQETRGTSFGAPAGCWRFERHPGPAAAAAFKGRKRDWTPVRYQRGIHTTSSSAVEWGSHLFINRSATREGQPLRCCGGRLSVTLASNSPSSRWCRSAVVSSSCSLWACGIAELIIHGVGIDGCVLGTRRVDQNTFAVTLDRRPAHMSRAGNGALAGGRA